MKKHIFFFLLSFFIGLFVSAQSPDVLTIRKYTNQNGDKIIKEFVNFLSIPNLAKDTVNIKKTAAFVMDMMSKRGISNIQLLNPTTARVKGILQAADTIWKYRSADQRSRRPGDASQCECLCTAGGIVLVIRVCRSDRMIRDDQVITVISALHKYADKCTVITRDL